MSFHFCYELLTVFVMNTHDHGAMVLYASHMHLSSVKQCGGRGWGDGESKLFPFDKIDFVFNQFLLLTETVN